MNWKDHALLVSKFPYAPPPTKTAEGIENICTQFRRVIRLQLRKVLLNGEKKFYGCLQEAAKKEILIIISTQS